MNMNKLEKARQYFRDALSEATCYIGVSKSLSGVDMEQLEYYDIAEKAIRKYMNSISFWDTVFFQRIGVTCTYTHFCDNCRYSYQDTKEAGYSYCPACGSKMEVPQK